MQYCLTIFYKHLYSQYGGKVSSIEEKNLSWAISACETSSDQSWTDHVSASIAREMCMILEQINAYLNRWFVTFWNSIFWAINFVKIVWMCTAFLLTRFKGTELRKLMYSWDRVIALAPAAILIKLNSIPDLLCVFLWMKKRLKQSNLSNLKLEVNHVQNSSMNA